MVTLIQRTSDPDLTTTSTDLLAQRLFLDVALLTDDQPEEDTKGGMVIQQGKEGHLNGLMPGAVHPPRAHKVLLCLFSPVLKRMLVEEATASSVFLHGTTAKDVRLLLDFMYTGEARVPAENLNSFMALATELQVAGFSGKSDSDEVSTVTESLPKKKARRRRKLRKEVNYVVEDIEQASTNAQVLTLMRHQCSTIDMDRSGQEGQRGSVQDQSHRRVGLTGSLGSQRGRGVGLTGSTGYECLVCSTKIKSRRNMKRHMRDQHTNRDTTYNCPFCKTAYQNRSSLYAHVHKVHRDVKGLNLKQCAVKKGIGAEGSNNKEEEVIVTVDF